MTKAAPPNGKLLDQCVVCSSTEAITIHHVADAPIYPFRPAGSNPEGSFGALDIVRCQGCGHVYNSAFDPEAAEDLYGAFVLTNTPVSEQMVKAVEGTADWISSRAGSKDLVLEVGGGAGALALALARRGSEVHLVEPSRALAPDRFEGTGVTFYQSMFPNPALGERMFDIVICRQVLEHVPAPAPFLNDLRSRLNEGGIAYIEIPSAEYIFENQSIVDFHYPHVHYYGRASVETLFRRAGFEILESCVIKDGHDVGFLLCGIPPGEAQIQETSNSGLAEVLSGARERATSRLAEISGPVALYGANAYSQALFGLFPDFTGFASMYDDTESYVGYSAYGAKAELPIGPPDPEQISNVAAVIITAYLHDEPIARKLRAMGYEGQIYTVRCDGLAATGDRPESLFG